MKREIGCSVVGYGNLDGTCRTARGPCLSGHQSRRDIETSFEFCMDLMEKTGIIVTPGSAFGEHGEGYVRMALVADKEKIGEILKVIKESGILKK